MNRPRGLYSCLVIFVIFLGLASRKWPVLGKFPGDALWAVMVFLLLAILRPRLSTLRLACWALLISYVDEISQLYQSSWIKVIRAITLGHLVLGSTFAWGDMLAYTAGISGAVLCEFAARSWLRR